MSIGSSEPVKIVFALPLLLLRNFDTSSFVSFWGIAGTSGVGKAVFGISGFLNNEVISILDKYIKFQNVLLPYFRETCKYRRACRGPFSSLRI
jgi:hypothetical protein